MAIPAIPAQGAPWLTYAQALDDEIRTGRLSDAELRATFDARHVVTFPVRESVGDGTPAETTAAIQAVVNAAAAFVALYSTTGRAEVVLTPRLYTLAGAGTKTVSLAGGGTNSQGYCLSLPSRVTIYGRGATLRLSSGDNALVMNANPNATTDTDLGLRHVTLDGNGVQLVDANLLLFTGITRPRLERVRVNNGTRFGICTYNNDQGVYDDLTSDGYVGNPFAFGQPFSGKTERGATFGRVVARNITADTVNPTNMPGNSFYGVLTDSTVAEIAGYSCTGGAKFQGGSDVVIGRVLLVNGGDGTGNSGLKFQASALRHSVGQVTANGMAGSGLLVDSTCTDITISQYRGRGNALLGTWPDVWVDGTRTTISSISSRNAGRMGVEVRSSAVDYRLGSTSVTNPGQVTGSGASTSAGVAVGGGSGAIVDLTCADDQATKTMNRGFDVSGAAASLRVLSYTHSGSSTPFNLSGFASDDVLVLNPRLGTDRPLGEFSPAAAATTTTVANNSVLTLGAGPYTQPIVEVTPMNSAARALGTVYVTFPSTGNIRLNHAAAAGTEKFRFRIIGYARTATLAA